MTRRSAIVLVGLILVLGALMAMPAQAAILPACDQTIYLLPKPDDPLGCDGTDASKCVQMDPIEYDTKYPTQAEKEQNPPIVTTTQNCGFNDFVQLFINLANWGLGILAVLALFFAIWGGIVLLTSGGNQERVREGKATIWGGFLGATIVLIAWVLIGFIVSAISGTGPVLFAGTKYARTFAGKSPCPASYKACAEDNLRLKCRDDKKNKDAVSRAQTILADLGCYRIDIDGCFGPKSDAATRAFQGANAGITLTAIGTPPKDYHMPASGESGYMDGIIGPITWMFLNQSAAGNTSVKDCRGS